ncbi:alkaline phosphatase family protein [Mycobacterium sp. ITM-2016-00318]|uniref:alkaline phosphatase family protein n=1 Tax=Mycobacterium sp. ITM-2016-00318 TaxID=2099693 RepID=UPI000CF85A3F|nr:alkaline phosphatase family protein [Mycobacterium sp. ITM-2016-00318]WNG91152.1 alkaline phosphatase family protein [Mycobacterium sp. ITM-2016-00318]
MGYARHIGRVGALAVTLGVGAAIANAPGIAYADTTGASTGGDSSQKTTTSTTDTSSTTGQTSSTIDGAAADAGDSGSTTSDPTSQRRSVLRTVVGAIRDIADDAVAAGNAAGATTRLGKQDPAGGDSANRQTSNITTTVTNTRTRADTLDDAAENLQSTVDTFTQRVEQAVQKYTAPTLDSTPSPAATAEPQPITTAAVTPLFEPRQRTSVVPLFTNALGAVLQPVIYGDGVPGLPQLPTLMAVIAAVRDELERTLGARPPQPVYPPTTSQPIGDPTLPAPTDQHVLVIAVDGTNMSEVLQEDLTPNTNFINLMNTSTTSAPSIVGHTTVSNPSWTAVFTGAWDNKTGVINNVYTPWTYERWPSVFTQLETANPDIRTKAIADWDVIAAISDSGVGADEVVYIAQKPDDPTWEKTDKAVTDEAVATLKGPNGNYTGEAPNFTVAYLVQVDEAGHQYGGDSLEYDAALKRTDDNLGAILEAVAAREAATGEDWTVIVVTDHGHQPQPGFGHGFQSPRETDTFVIVDGPQFENKTDTCTTECGRFNPEYEIVDVTPTVLSLFNVPQDPRSDGVPLQSLNGSSTNPLSQAVLHDALEAQMASNDYPNIIVNAALSTRTIVAFIPYFVYDQDLPAPLGDILYVATNTPAQAVALATGVWGARLFQILPPPPIVITPEGPNSLEAAFRTDCGSVSLDPAGCVAV